MCKTEINSKKVDLPEIKYVKRQIRELITTLEPINDKINLVFILDQLKRDKILYKLNINELISTLKYYNIYILDKIYKILDK